MQSPTTGSVGICSPDRNDGIQYLFNNTYTQGASSLVGGRAIKFTTGSEYITSVDENPIHPGQYYLAQNYPNPFNPTTTINFAIPERQIVTLDIYSILGEKLVTLVNEVLEAGDHAAVWDASEMPSGVYFYRLSSGNEQLTRRMILLK